MTASTLNAMPAAGFDLTLSADTIRAEERARIAREIHDELGAHLMALKISLKFASKAANPSQREIDAQWAEMLGQVDAAMGVVADIAEQLRPCVVAQVGLRPAIESYVRQFRKITRIACGLWIDVSHLSLRGDAASEIFRIFQEALTNVARHAEASQVDIKIRVDNGRLKIEISDNGKGIPADKILDPHSSGVAGMFERARRIGGEFHVEGLPEGGTKVTVRAPLPTAQ